MYEPERLTSFDLVLAFDSYSAPVDAGAFNTNGMHGVLMIIQCGSGRACAMNIDISISMSVSVSMSVCLSMCIFVFLYFGIISFSFLRLNVEILLTSA